MHIDHFHRSAEVWGERHPLPPFCPCVEPMLSAHAYLPPQGIEGERHLGLESFAASREHVVLVQVGTVQVIEEWLPWHPLRK